MRVTVLTILAIGIASAIATHNFYKRLQSPVDILNLYRQDAAESADQSVSHRHKWHIGQGSSLNAVIANLNNKGVIKNPDILKIYAKLTGRTSVQTGTYWIENSDTEVSLLLKFNRGVVVVNKLTFPEGWNFRQWRKHLGSEEQFAHIKTMSDRELLSYLRVDIHHPEGWFFPDTYRYTDADTLEDILGRAHDQMRSILNLSWKERDSNLPYTNPYEALIMASIIEKETGVPKERKMISGVFINRLKKGMRLQTDPTVIYGLGDRFSGNLKRSHLKENTPYNTYLIKGLPPTPISMPGRAAIKAALNPAAHENLYFVAKGDGSHYFSSSLKEHKRAVQKYQIQQRKKNYRSSVE